MYASNASGDAYRFQISDSEISEKTSGFNYVLFKLKQALQIALTKAAAIRFPKIIPNVFHKHHFLPCVQ